MYNVGDEVFVFDGSSFGCNIQCKISPGIYKIVSIESRIRFEIIINAKVYDFYDNNWIIRADDEWYVPSNQFCHSNNLTRILYGI